jgi:hypothetical protein
MLARTHLFGSTDGYRTLARANGVSDAEDAALAALGFGSPRTEEEFALLQNELCVAGRPLPSGRYAITRVFAGAPDVAGRRTIERRTLVLEMSDWRSLAQSDLRATLQDDRNWSRDAFADGTALDVRRHEMADLLPTPGDPERRVFDALLSAHPAHRCAAFPNVEPWSTAILRLPMLLPSQQQSLVGWGVGLWSVPSGVSIATLHQNAGARNAFSAATSGPWRHPDAVMRLGRDFMPRSSGSSDRSPRLRQRNLGRHLPMAAGLMAMLLAGLMLWWAVQQRTATEAPRSAQRSSPRNMPQAPPESSIAVASPTRPIAPATPSTPATSPPDASSTQTVQAASATGGAFGAASETGTNDAFGSGSSDAMQAPEPAEMSAEPSPESPAPEPASAPTPEARPNIPQVPTDSAPWDAEVGLARQAIDLNARAREITTKEQGAALIAQLAQQADALVRAHREADRMAGKSAPTERCLILIDTRNRKRGLTDMVKREQLAHAFSPLVVQRMLLLCARFELSLAVQDLARRQLIDMGALPKELRGDVRADGWPDETPWVLWYFRNKDAPVSTPADGARYMASEFDAALDGHPGTRGAQKILEELANRAPREAAP